MSSSIGAPALVAVAGLVYLLLGRALDRRIEGSWRYGKATMLVGLVWVLVFGVIAIASLFE